MAFLPEDLVLFVGLPTVLLRKPCNFVTDFWLAYPNSYLDIKIRLFYEDTVALRRFALVS
jgi:hypothetical protein